MILFVRKITRVTVEIQKMRIKERKTKFKRKPTYKIIMKTVGLIRMRRKIINNKTYVMEIIMMCTIYLTQNPLAKYLYVRNTNIVYTYYNIKYIIICNNNNRI